MTVNMLDLQRASAGSGKTFSLTRTYLKLLLGRRRDDGSYRLCEPGETRDSHSRLLAITFTNKATAEMRRRFIDKLAGLADPVNYTVATYMEDFRKEFGEPAERIQRIAALTLSAVLNHYSDFQVSTIDSFFQQILHSFTYEAELPDNYVVELDTELVIKASLETLFAEAAGNPGGDVRYWLSEYMNRRQRKGLKWNLSQRGKGSAYGDLFGYLRMIDKEDFKQEREALEQYFLEIGNLRGLDNEVKKLGAAYVERMFAAVCDKAVELREAFRRHGVGEYMHSSLRKRLEKIEKASAAAYCFDPKKDLSSLSSILLKKGASMLAEGEVSALGIQEDELCGCINRWKASPRYVSLVADSIPVLALIRHLLAHMEAYRTENNIVQLSDTNTILRTITKDTEVPFIYEKIGTGIDSYLIDEFQDTSALQWENMKPLVEQSLSEGNDNLIIGDAKQSIYRFRNADSTLITTQVPADFRSTQLRMLGTTPGENANWRSAPEVVRFNNSLFTCLSAMSGNRSVAAAYGGVPQVPVRKNLRGYVQITDVSVADGDTDAVMPYLGPAITDMMARGYRQKDIAILVRTNEEGRKAVKALVDYNSSLRGTAGFCPVEFISDEALLISRARSVEITVAMLRLVKGEPVESDGAGGVAESYSRYAGTLETELNRFRADNPDMPAEALLELYFNGGVPAGRMTRRLASASSAALPALVEIILAMYVPESLRRTEARYICAFQDAVARFCETKYSDVASFLHWWEDKKDSLCVTSPEDADAVNILTVHKSKGLEWRCVIVAEFNGRLDVSGSEQAWLKPREPFAGTAPPILPLSLASRKDFVNTPYEQEYLDVENKTGLDALNIAYVAFTRAVDELYVFANPAKKAPSVAGLMRRIVSNPESLALAGGASAGLFVNLADVRLSDAAGSGGVLFTYGSKPDREYVLARGRIMDEENLGSDCSGETETIECYDVNRRVALPVCVAEDSPDVTDISGTTSQRRLGTVRHAVLEGIRQSRDVDREVERMLLRCKVRGMLSEEEAAEIGKELHESLADDRVRRWFGPDVKAYAERPIYHDAGGGVDNSAARRDEWRPDRVVVDRQGNALVIDYKFGKPYASHRRQVAEYMVLLRQTGQFASVSGVVWYLSVPKVEYVG